MSNLPKIRARVARLILEKRARNRRAVEMGLNPNLPEIYKGSAWMQALRELSNQELATEVNILNANFFKRGSAADFILYESFRRLQKEGSAGK